MLYVEVTMTMRMAMKRMSARRALIPMVTKQKEG